jgi:hypothetical protein
VSCHEIGRNYDMLSITRLYAKLLASAIGLPYAAFALRIYCNAQ